MHLCKRLTTHFPKLISSSWWLKFVYVASCRLGIGIAPASEPSVASERLANAAAVTAAAAAAAVAKCPGSC